jgi:DNA helicase-2/ATP-dependent DNA helicase PcrA
VYQGGDLLRTYVLIFKNLHVRKGAGAIKPDAVSIMTVHQAKGMQWPVVFVPCLRKNRFPSKTPGGRSVWHIIPEQSVPNAPRYKGTIEDERRLFYVALTRAEKYLYGSWSPLPGNQQQQKSSPFFEEMTKSSYVLTKESSLSFPPSCESRPRKADVLLPLTFSQLKYYFDCPYLFKLRYLYGFNAPISRALGYGHSLHNALAEIHAESLQGNIPNVGDIPRLVDEHLHLPFADKVIEDNMRKGAVKTLTRYLQNHRQDLDKLEHVEKVIELTLSDGIVVSGRIDLIRKTDTQELSIVDFKSDQRAQDESLTEKQLQIYALGYQELTGQRADLIEIHNLDRGGIQREEVDDSLIQSTMQSVVEAGKKLRDDDLPRLYAWSNQCQGCDFVGICRQKEART